MVIIHPFHYISEDARHCSALSYRQVADRDYRVPEVIDRHSFNTYGECPSVALPAGADACFSTEKTGRSLLYDV